MLQYRLPFVFDFSNRCETGRAISKLLSRRQQVEPSPLPVVKFNRLTAKDLESGYVFPLTHRITSIPLLQSLDIIVDDLVESAPRGRSWEIVLKTSPRGVLTSSIIQVMVEEGGGAILPCRARNTISFLLVYSYVICENY